MGRRWSVCLLGTSLLAGPGCYTGLDTGGPDGVAGETEGAGSGGSDAGSDGGEGGGVPGVEAPSPGPRVARLTHQQWENTIRDLFYLAEPTGISETFRADPAQAGFIFDNDATTLEVDQALWSGYRRAALEVSALVAADEQILTAILPPDSGDPAARARAFVQEFGPRAYRRPLTPEEEEHLVGFFDEAPALFPGEDPFIAGVRMVIEAVLQSPHFLYRIEQSEAEEDGVIPLGEYEVASRMSYFLWNSMPDDELFVAAGASELLDPQMVEEQARRMLADPRAREVTAHFHDLLLETRDFEGIAPSEAFFPEAPAQLGALAQEENRRFVESVIFDRSGGWTELLTSTETFVNADLAEVYGLEGSYTEEFVSAQLDPEQRRGLFTQVGFLATNATSVNPDPIHRGVFLAERITCTKIAAPPDGVPPLPPVDGKTNRQTVEEHTEAPGTACQGCHSTWINPMGFPFENYDAMGAWRTEDNGFPVDASASVLLGDGRVDVANAVELIDLLAADPKVHECYMRHWIEYAQGRLSGSEDDAWVARLGERSLDDGAPVTDLLVELVTSPAFLNRSTEELP